MTTTLLAVDDSKTMRRVLEITFSGEEEYRTVLAQNADEALEKLRAERPRLVLVDANLGERTGYALCEQIKRQSPEVGVVLLSSKQQPYDRARGSAAGADDFIDKPFDTQQLIDKVAAVLQSKTAGQAAHAPAPAAQPVQQAPVQVQAALPQARPAGPGFGATLPGVARPPVQDSTGAVRPAVSVSGPSKAGPLAAVVGPAVVGPAAVPPAKAAPLPLPVSAAPARPAMIPAPSPPEPKKPVMPPAAPSVRTALHEPAPAVPATLAPEAPAPSATVAAAADAAQGALAARLQDLGLSKDQVEGVLSLSRDVLERVVWEVVPLLAETLIKEEIRRLTRE